MYRKKMLSLVDYHLGNNPFSQQAGNMFIVGAGTVLVRTGSYSAKHEELLIDSMRLRRLVTLRTAVGTLMTVPLPMPGGVH